MSAARSLVIEYAGLSRLCRASFPIVKGKIKPTRGVKIRSDLFLSVRRRLPPYLKVTGEVEFSKDVAEDILKAFIKSYGRKPVNGIRLPSWRLEKL